MNNTAYILAYQRPGFVSEITAEAERLFQARGVPLARVPSHVAVVLPAASGFTLYQAIATGVQDFGVADLTDPRVTTDLIETIDVYLPTMDRAIAWAQHQIGDAYAWSDIEESAIDELVPAFLAINGSYPKAKTFDCSAFCMGVLLAGGRDPGLQPGVVTPYVLTECARALSDDLAACVAALH